MSFIDGLQILFIGLKLTNNINWSWWWVLTPLWFEILIRIFLEEP